MKPTAAIALLFVLATAPAGAVDKAPGPPPLPAWLQATYGPQARWDGPWTAAGQRAGDRLSFNVCADSGPREQGLRYLMVCAAPEEAGHVDSGRYDLFVVRGEGRAARTVASLRGGVSAMGFGNADQATFIEIGPARTAILLEGGYTATGISQSRGTLVTFDGRTLTRAFEWASGYSDVSRCADDDDACARTATSTTCTLYLDRRTVVQGRYAARIAVRGTHDGRTVSETLPVPLQNGRYRLPSASRLAALGCGDGAE